MIGWKILCKKIRENIFADCKICNWITSSTKNKSQESSEMII